MKHNLLQVDTFFAEVEYDEALVGSYEVLTIVVTNVGAFNTAAVDELAVQKILEARVGVGKHVVATLVNANLQCLLGLLIAASHVIHFADVGV